MLLKLLLAAAGLYVIFIVAPSVVAGITIFRQRPGAGFDHLIAAGAQFAPYAGRMTEARQKLLSLPHREVSVSSQDGLTLWGDYCDLGREKTAVFVHGYRSDPMVTFAVQAEVFSRRGYNLLLIRQRGHGKDPKELTGMGLKEQGDVLCWKDWALAQPGVRAVVFYGVSMGASTLAYASDRLDPAEVEALVLDCGFVSPYEQIFGDCRKRHLPGVLMMPIVRLVARLRPGIDIRQSTLDALARTSVPCFFLHGTADETVPYAEGRQSYAACAARKAFFTAEGAGHTETFLSEPARAEEELFAFIQPQKHQEEHQL